VVAAVLPGEDQVFKLLRAEAPRAQLRPGLRGLSCAGQSGAILFEASVVACSLAARSVQDC
jgi:hypothetical protein